MGRRVSILLGSVLFGISFLASVCVAQNTAFVSIPLASGRLVIDGVPDEPAWQGAAKIALQPEGFGGPYPEGGVARMLVCGRYLCLSARAPEPGRVVALSIGRNPILNREDRIAWKLYSYARGRRRTTIILSVNPFGGFRLDYTSPVNLYSSDFGPPLHSVVGAIEQAEDWRTISGTWYGHGLVYWLPIRPAWGGLQALAAAHVGNSEWTVEGAIPLNDLATDLGYMSVERVRVPRPKAPELRWDFPAANVRAGFRLAKAAADAPNPVFRPPIVGGPEIGIPNSTHLPAADAPWNDRSWQAAASVELVRNEANPRPPRFPTEVRLLHDGNTLAVFARLEEPGPLVARGSVHDDPTLVSGDNLELFLSPSGGEFVELMVNPNGALLDTMGSGPGGKAFPADSWNSKVAVHVARERSAWTVRMDISLAEIAHVLDEAAVPARWRVLIRRSRPARNDSRGEVSTFPLVLSSAPFCPARYQPIRLLRGPSPNATSAAPARPGEDVLARELRTVPVRVWSESERRSLGINQMIERRLRRRMLEAAESEKGQWQQVRTLAEWRQFREKRIEALRRSLGLFPERTPLHVVVTHRANYGDGFAIENIVFESRPRLEVTGNLYLPTRISGRIPAIVVVHSHHAPKTQAELQLMGMNWARAGAAVLVIDQLCAGERVQSNPWMGESYYGRYALDEQLELAGESLMKWMVWDLMRSIDLLLERPYIDPKRIAVIGSVAGGGDPAAITAALDGRVAAVAPFNFGEAGPEEHYVPKAFVRRGPNRYPLDVAWPGWGSWDLTRNLPHSVAGQFFPWFICASIAPRRFLYSFEMAWPQGIKNESAWTRYKKVFELYGKPDNLSEVHGFGPIPGAGERPNVGVEHRLAIYPIFKRWLNIPSPTSEYSRTRPAEELMCLTPAIAAEHTPKPAVAIALKMAQARLARARVCLLHMDRKARRRALAAALQAKLGDITPNRNPSAQVVWSRSYSRFKVEAMALDTEPGITVPLLFLKPRSDGVPVRRAPVVIGLAQSGKERFLSDRLTEIEALLKRGIAVCLADLRGTGELGTGDRAPGGMTLSTVELMLGDTRLGLQVKDARTVFTYISHRPDVDRERIVLWGDSFAGINPPKLMIDESPVLRLGPQVQYQAEPTGSMIALLAALYEPGVRAVASRRGLSSYLSALRDPFCYLPEDSIVPGMLEAGDVADVVASLAHTPVLLEGFVDGKDCAVSDANLKAEFQPAYIAYQSTPSRLIIRKISAEPHITDWLAYQCGLGSRVE